MKYSKLGNSELIVSEISFGCMSLGENSAENTNLLRSAFEQGINFFDTADLYQKGANEEFVGKAFKGVREQVLIATKAGNQWREDRSGWDWNPGKDYILSAIDKSLARLQTDYVDLYQMHGGTLEDPIEEIVETMETLQQQGKIRYYGISSIRPNVIRKYIDSSKISSVMMQYSLLDRRGEEACLELLRESNIGVLARGSLARGLLIDKQAESYLNYSSQEVKDINSTIQQLFEEKYSKLEVSLGYVLLNRAITTAVVGISNIDQLEGLTKFSNIFSIEDRKILEKEIPSNFYQDHR